MAGLGVIAILFGCVTAWSGYNDQSAYTVIRDSITGAAMPGYTKGAGARKVVAEVLSFELIKAAAQGLSSLVPGLLPAGGGKGGAGEGESSGKGAEGEGGGGEPVVGEGGGLPDIPLELASQFQPGTPTPQVNGTTLA